LLHDFFNKKHVCFEKEFSEAKPNQKAALVSLAEKTHKFQERLLPPTRDTPARNDVSTKK
jgi:hypothetical protein